MPTKLSHQILEQLIYDRVRTRLTIRELRTIDAELRQNIAETLRAAADNKEDRDQLALEFLERAWRRVAAESETQLPSQDRGALVAAA